MSEETKEEAPALPDTIEEVDALRLECKSVKAELARVQAQKIIDEYQAELAACVAKYKVDGDKGDRIDMAALKIIRGKR